MKNILLKVKKFLLSFTIEGKLQALQVKHETNKANLDMEVNVLKAVKKAVASMEEGPEKDLMVGVAERVEKEIKQLSNHIANIAVAISVISATKNLDDKVDYMDKNSNTPM